jgi:hypothetical protein
MNRIQSEELNRIKPELEKYKHLLPWETYRRYRLGQFPSAILFLFQAPDLAQTIADIAKQETNHDCTAPST